MNQIASLLAVTLAASPCAALAQHLTAAEVQSAQDAQYAQLEQYLDRAVAEADRQRTAAWQRDYSSLEAYEKSIEPWRERLFDMLGGNVYQPVDLEPAEELVAELSSHKAYRVSIRAFEGVSVYGILLVPVGPGPFPAIICVHGMGGTPEGVCGLLPQADYHNNFGLQAVQRGYVAFAPLDMNSPKKRSWLDRKAIMAGQRLQALEQYKMIRVLDYLQSRSDVMADRIGAYGISWGGRTVMNLAALDRRVAACAISGHFNDLLPKMLLPSPHYTAYIETAEDYAFFSNQAGTFNDADVVSLICPRPVLVEQGRDDRVAHWRMSQHAFEEVTRHYQQLGIAERAAYHVFEGGHVVRGAETFEFLDRWLRPTP